MGLLSPVCGGKGGLVTTSLTSAQPSVKLMRNAYVSSASAPMVCGASVTTVLPPLLSAGTACSSILVERYFVWSAVHNNLARPPVAVVSDVCARQHLILNRVGAFFRAHYKGNPSAQLTAVIKTYGNLFAVIPRFHPSQWPQQSTCVLATSSSFGPSATCASACSLSTSSPATAPGAPPALSSLAVANLSAGSPSASCPSCPLASSVAGVSSSGCFLQLPVLRSALAQTDSPAARHRFHIRGHSPPHPRFCRHSRRRAGCGRGT